MAFLLLGVVAMLCTSCSSFHREWREAVASPRASGIAGPWEGHWVSDANGHRGKLRCLVSPSEDQTGTYAFRYWAKWGWLSGSFATAYPVEEVAPDRWRFSGDSDLGSLGGIYRHEGEATATQFKADFHSSKGDRGTMEMSRPVKP